MKSSNFFSHLKWQCLSHRSEVSRFQPGTETCSDQILQNFAASQAGKWKKKKGAEELEEYQIINGYLFWVGFGMLGGILRKLAIVCLSCIFASHCKFLSVCSCNNNLLACPPLGVGVLLSWQIDRDKWKWSMSITAVSVAKDLKWVVMDLSVSAREDDGLQY